MYKVTVISADDVKRVLSNIDYEELVDLMKIVFESLSSFSGDKRNMIAAPLRTSIVSPSSTALFMPARISTAGGTGIKVVAVPRDGASMAGLPASSFLLDEETGRLKAVINAGHLTAVRNAAGSALATRLAGVTSPDHLVLFGAGLQSLYHAKAFLSIYSSTIKSCTIVNRSLNQRLSRLHDVLIVEFPAILFNVQRLDDIRSVQRSLAQADIVCTATSSESALFATSWLNPDAHVNLIGSYKPTMREVEPELIDQASLIIVDSVKTCLVEAGELINTQPDRLVELGTLSLSKTTYKREPSRRTIFKSVGVGVQDTAIAAAVFGRAQGMGLGVTIDYE